MLRRRDGLKRFLLAALGIAYPFAVYGLFGKVPLWTFFAAALLVGGGQLYRMRRQDGFAAVALAGLAGASVLAGVFFVDALGAVQAYPVAVSLGFAAAFGFSLWRGPTAVERIARLTRPELPPAGVRYARTVTWVWFWFLILNAAISLAAILWGTLAQWALWSGFLSYVAMGALFAGEYVVRRRVLPP